MTAAIKALARVLVRAWVNRGQRSKLQPPDIQKISAWKGPGQASGQ